MENETRVTESESYPMIGGDGAYSYAKNSSYQRACATPLKSVVDEEITKSLDVKKLSLISSTIHLADFGCATGPNTFIHMQDLIDSVTRKYQTQAPSEKLPEFQVFFSDHSLNDFNTLFTSLPPERQYFVAGVPSSFYGRLFPNSSLHLVYSSYALHWLSMSPKRCIDTNADAYNKGKIHYFGASSVVVEAYATQFANDMGAFLNARANEIMIGGMLVMILLGSPKDVPHTYYWIWYRREARPEKMENERRVTEPESYPMIGGDGAYSYAKNSSYQREVATAVKSVVDEEITKSLEVKKLSLISSTIRLADLGCSTGPNTFIQMQDLIDSVTRKYQTQAPSEKLPEFQVFFSDHSSNDFNTLFTSLPPERQYFVAGVPGSFYGLLFPNSSLHLVYSSYALHWLSMSPKRCIDTNADAYNKGKIHYFGASSVVVEAYATQFANDMGAFLNARANEIMIGGMLVMILLGSPKDVPHTYLGFVRFVGLLESILLDMVQTGMISESKLDSFNIPMYFACPEEMVMAVEKGGEFSIEKLELTPPTIPHVDLKARIVLARAAIEPLFSKHFGSEVCNELFDQMNVKMKEHSNMFQSSHLEKSLLLVVLKRK